MEDEFDKQLQEYVEKEFFTKMNYKTYEEFIENEFM